MTSCSGLRFKVENLHPRVHQEVERNLVHLQSKQQELPQIRDSRTMPNNASPGAKPQFEIPGCENLKFLNFQIPENRNMDPALHPAINLRPTSSRPVSAKNVAIRLGNFVEDFQARTTAAQGGNTAVTVQLQKLKDAMEEELESKK